MDWTAEEIGLRVAALTTSRGWSGRELGRRTGLSAQAANELLAGKRRPHVTTKAILAEVFGWPDFDTLMATEEVQPPVPHRNGAVSGTEEVAQRAAEIVLAQLAPQARLLDGSPRALQVDGEPPPPDVEPGRMKTVEMVGEHMIGDDPRRALLPGDLLTVDTELAPQRGDVVWVQLRTGEERVGYWESANPGTLSLRAARGRGIVQPLAPGTIVGVVLSLNRVLRRPGELGRHDAAAAS